MEDNIIQTLKKMQYHFSMVIEEYEKLPQLRNVVRRTVLEDALSVVGATMDGITHEIIDAWRYQQQQKIYYGDNENEKKENKDRN